MPRLMFSVGYTADIVNFTWLPESVEIDENMQLPQFELEDIIQRDCTQNYTAGTKPRLMSHRSAAHIHNHLLVTVTLFGLRS